MHGGGDDDGGGVWGGRRGADGVCAAADVERSQAAEREDGCAGSRGEAEPVMVTVVEAARRSACRCRPVTIGGRLTRSVSSRVACIASWLEWAWRR